MRRLLPVAAAIALTLVVGSADVWAHTDAPPPSGSQPTENISAGRSSGKGNGLTSASETPASQQSFAAREASAKGLEKFEGGDVIVIGASTAAIVLLIILILIII
jgi:hypothetical protein